MLSKTKKITFITVVSVAALSVTCYLCRKEIVASMKAYYLGRVMVAADEFGQHLGTVDEVEVLALAETTRDDLPDTFHGDLGFRAATAARRTIRDAELDRLLKVWRFLPVGHQYRSLCFQPHYALRFRRGGSLLFETVLCWKCGTYTLPAGVFGTTEYGFDSSSKDAQELLELLTEFTSHPPKS